MGSSVNKLAKNGWLSLNEFVKYLRTDFPEHYVSYPTALSMVRENKLRAITVGSSYRIYQEEITRYIRDGNYDPGKRNEIPAEVIAIAEQQTHKQQIRPQLKLVPQVELPESDDV